MLMAACVYVCSLFFLSHFAFEKEPAFKNSQGLKATLGEGYTYDCHQGP